MVWGSHSGGPWRPTGGHVPRPCSREGARRGWRTHDCSIIEMTKALYVTFLRRLQALAPNFQPSLVLPLSAEIIQTQRYSFTIIRHVETSLLFNMAFYHMRTFLKFHKFKENGDSCLPLLNVIGELLCLTLPSLFVLVFSTPAQSYFIFPYLHFPSLHICTCFFHTCIFHPCTAVLDFSVLAFSYAPPLAQGGEIFA